MTSTIERNYMYSQGNTEEWQEQRRLDMRFIGGLMALAEKFPGQELHGIITELPTFKKGK